MKTMGKSWVNLQSLVWALVIPVFICSCNPTDDIPISDVLPEEIHVVEEPEVVEKPVVLAIKDLSAYSAIIDPDYYMGKYLGEIFLIKSWKSSAPLVNSLSVFGKIKMAPHPDQPLETLEFKDPTQPTVLTGYGEGWGSMEWRGEGEGISSVCTGAVLADFRLLGSFYPAPTCLLDVDIVTTYFLQEEIMVHCVYNDGMELDLQMPSWVDMFTDVKLPIVFKVPDKYLVPYNETKDNMTYDFSYYLFNFWGKVPSDEYLSLTLGDSLTLGGIPVQFYNTGCPDVHINLDPGLIPEEIRGTEEIPPDVWDMMLKSSFEIDFPPP